MLNSYEVGTKISTSLDQNDLEFSNAKRLKHKIRPTLGYTYRGYQDEDEISPCEFEAIEEGQQPTRSPWPSKLWMPVLKMTMGMCLIANGANLLSVRRIMLKKKGEAVELGIDRHRFEPLYAELILRPFQGFSLFGETEWDYYDQKITFADVALDYTIARWGAEKTYSGQTLFLGRGYRRVLISGLI